MQANIGDGGTRWAAHEASTGQAPEIPQIEAGAYLLDALRDLGFASIVGMGALVSVSWAEIAGYMQATAGISDGWEARLVRRMSGAYIEWMKRGENPLCKPPREP